MPNINSKASLAVEISKLKSFENPKVREEQYSTEPDIAAEIIWNMHMSGEIQGKCIADLGSGTGFLGLGALLIGAKKVFFVEKDTNADNIARKNYATLLEKGYELEEAVFLNQDIEEFKEHSDIVIQNPPFGTKEKHADRNFLDKAFRTAGIVWSFHKSSTESFVEAFSADNGFRISARIKFAFPLHYAHSFHTRKIHRIEVTLFRIEKSMAK